MEKIFRRALDLACLGGLLWLLASSSSGMRSTKTDLEEERKIQPIRACYQKIGDHYLADEICKNNCLRISYLKTGDVSETYRQCGY